MVRVVGLEMEMSDATNGRRRILAELAPADYIDPVVEAYKKDVDRTLLRENLKLTVEERILKHAAVWKFAQGLRAAKFVENRDG